MTDPRRLSQYASAAGAREYLEEYDKWHRKWSDRRERKLLARWFARIGRVRSATDLPCGWGRYLPMLQAQGARVIEADFSGSMVQMSRERHAATPALAGLRCMGHRIPLRDGAVELSFSMRLNHHLTDPCVRAEHVSEVLRIASRWAIFSYFDHASVKNLLRRARTKLGLTRKPPKHTLRRGQVRALVAQAGFRIVEDPWLFAIGSGHRIVLAERIGCEALYDQRPAW